MLRKRQNLQVKVDKLKLKMEIAKEKAREEIYFGDGNDMNKANKHVHYPLEPMTDVMSPINYELLHNQSLGPRVNTYVLSLWIHLPSAVINNTVC